MKKLFLSTFTTLSFACSIAFAGVGDSGGGSKNMNLQLPEEPVLTCQSSKFTATISKVQVAYKLTVLSNNSSSVSMITVQKSGDYLFFTSKTGTLSLTVNTSEEIITGSLSESGRPVDNSLICEFN